MGDLLVVIILGPFGVHKFLEGKHKLGLAYLFTFGLFGIGWIFDIVVAFQKYYDSIPSRTKPVPESESSQNQVESHKSSVDRIYKGIRLNDFVDDYTVIDLETTGFSPRNDKIIELAAIRVRNNTITEKYTTLINPGIHIPSSITNITNISDEMVSDAPDIKDVISEFVAFIGNDIVVGHNVNFDINFIYDRCMLFLEKPFSNDFIDTLYIARRKLPELKHHRLSDLVEYYGIDPGTAHRSLCDCEATYQLYDTLRK